MKRKTIEQRLQSRLSKRRNAIRRVEYDIEELQLKRALVRACTRMYDYFPNFLGCSEVELNHKIKNLRDIAKDMADDQRLDKTLKLRAVISNRGYFR